MIDPWWLPTLAVLVVIGWIPATVIGIMIAVRITERRYDRD